MVVDPQAPELTVSDFRSLALATNTCLLLHDAATKRILWANPAACELLGWSVAELRPLTASDMSSSAQQYDRVLGRAWLQVAAETGVNRIEWHYRTRDGRVIPTEAVAVRVELAQGPALLVHFRDIEREQAIERQLRLTTSYVESLAQHTSTIAVMLDAAGVVRFATDTALAALGAPAEREPGRLEDLARITVGSAPGGPVGWTAVAATAAPVTHVQLDVTRPGGERAWLEGTLEAVQGGDEQDGFLMILHDVSDRVHGQLRRQRELHQENYLARYNAMGDMAMAIAHELGQPLAAAYNFLAGAAARARTAGVRRPRARTRSRTASRAPPGRSSVPGRSSTRSGRSWGTSSRSSARRTSTGSSTSASTSCSCGPRTPGSRSAWTSRPIPCTCAASAC
ncbi:PAS domain-containing protein [Nocardioides zeae]